MRSRGTFGAPWPGCLAPPSSPVAGAAPRVPAGPGRDGRASARASRRRGRRCSARPRREPWPRTPVAAPAPWRASGPRSRRSPSGRSPRPAARSGDRPGAAPSASAASPPRDLAVRPRRDRRPRRARSGARASPRRGERWTARAPPACVPPGGPRRGPAPAQASGARPRCLLIAFPGRGGSGPPGGGRPRRAAMPVPGRAWPSVPRSPWRAWLPRVLPPLLVNEPCSGRAAPRMGHRSARRRGRDRHPGARRNTGRARSEPLPACDGHRLDEGSPRWRCPGRPPERRPDRSSPSDPPGRASHPDLPDASRSSSDTRGTQAPSRRAVAPDPPTAAVPRGCPDRAGAPAAGPAVPRQARSCGGALRRVWRSDVPGAPPATRSEPGRGCRARSR